MNLLALDTSSDSMVLGLQLGAQTLDRSTVTGRSHSRDLLPGIEALMAEAGITLGELDAVVFGQGPGSFTGLRIAVGVVQGLAYGLDIPVVPVSSMACLAQAAHRQQGAQLVAVALKARLEEVYFGAYSFAEGIAATMDSEMVLDVSDLPSQRAGEWVGVGDGWEFKDKLERSLQITVRHISRETVPGVLDLVTIGQHKLANNETVSALQAAPVYLREQVAVKPGPRKTTGSKQKRGSKSPRGSK